MVVKKKSGGGFGLKTLTILYLMAVVVVVIFFRDVQAEFEAIRDHDKNLVCYAVKRSATGERKPYGEPIVLEWKNFLAFDPKTGKMVFLRSDEGLHKVPTRGYQCLPEGSWGKS